MGFSLVIVIKMDELSKSKIPKGDISLLVEGHFDHFGSSISTSHIMYFFRQQFGEIEKNPIYKSLLETLKEEVLQNSDPISQKQLREMIVDDLEKRFSSPIKYPKIQITGQELKKGSRVKIRRDSQYYDQNEGIGTMRGDFDNGRYANVDFDDGYTNCYMPQDLEPVLLPRQLEEITKQISQESFDQFKEDMQKQVQEKIESSSISISEDCKDFKVGDKVRFSKQAIKDFPHIKEYSSEGTIKECEETSVDVSFTKLTRENIGQVPEVFHVSYGYLEKLVSIEEIARMTQKIGGDKNLAQDLVQKSIDKILNILASQSAKETLSKEFITGLQEQDIISKECDEDGGYEVNREKVSKLIKRKEKQDQKGCIEFVKSSGANPDVLRRKTYVYTPDLSKPVKGKKLDPYSIGEQFLDDLLVVAQTYASNQRQQDLLMLSKQIIKEKNLPSKDDFIRILSKPNKQFFSDLQTVLERLKIEQNDNKKCRQFNFLDDEEIKGNLALVDSPEKWSNFGVHGLYLSYRDIAVSELLSIMETAGKDNQQVYTDFSTVWNRFKPQIYDLSTTEFRNEFRHVFNNGGLKSQYRFSVTRDPDLLFRAVKNSGACLNEKGVKTFVGDKGTVNLCAYHGNNLIGYIRFFLMKANDNKLALALDTLEVGGKEFDNNIDTVRAMGLASIQFGLDANVKYILGGEGRVSCGLRQAFGNRYMKTNLKKLGLTNFGRHSRNGPYSYRFDSSTGEYKSKTSLLMLNWRI